MASRAWQVSPQRQVKRRTGLILASMVSRVMKAMMKVVMAMVVKSEA
jgi:hypothetical protein